VLRYSALLLLLVRAVECGGNSTKPHVIFFLVDDYGWGGAGWHNTVESGGQREVQTTPNMDDLVSTGINLNSTSRSSSARPRDRPSSRVVTLSM
jgi:hypothetical protein